MPDEPTKTADQTSEKGQAHPEQGKSDPTKEIVDAVTGKAADSKGPQSHGTDQADALKQLEDQFSKRLDKAFSAFDKKLTSLRDELSAGHRNDLDDEGETPSQSAPQNAELNELRQAVQSLQQQQQTKDQEQRVISALSKVKQTTDDGQAGLNDAQIKAAYEFLNTDEAKMAGFGLHNFQSPVGIRALAAAAGALVPQPSGPQGADAPGLLLNANEMRFDPITGEVIQPGIPADDDAIRKLPLAERSAARIARTLNELERKGQL